MMLDYHSHRCARRALALMLIAFWLLPRTADAQEPEILHPQLKVSTVLDGLDTPTTMAFIDQNEFLVLEKNTGQVVHVKDGSTTSVALDLAVNFASERGLLGIALDPDFPDNPGVYLFWTESSTGSDTDVLSNTSVLGNRVDRFIWEAGSLTFDHNLIFIRAIQTDDGQPERGNHDGGVLAFGLDEKLYIFIGDLGRRGQLQNLPCGPSATCPGEIVADDQFGGPQPDDAHLSGVVLRLNRDGSAPEDNPFFDFGAQTGGEVGANLQKIYTYGHRNSFGMAVHPRTGDLWLQENGDDSFSELNRLEPGLNGGWVQIAGPVDRIHQFKEIETTFNDQQMQQLRWPPTNIADTPEEALNRLFVIPGSHYSDPEFSWKWEVAPGGIGFVSGRSLGPQFEGDLFMGAAVPVLEGGYLFRFKLTGNGRNVAVDDPRIEDRVADNEAKHDLTESESLLIGRNFGTVTDIEMGPDGFLYLVSLTTGSILRIEPTRTRNAQGPPHTPPGRAKASIHPNPFNPSTTIAYSLPDEAHVRVEIFDVMGRSVALLVDGVRPGGEHAVRFDASHLPSGTYLLRVLVGDRSTVRTMQLLK